MRAGVRRVPTTARARSSREVEKEAQEKRARDKAPMPDLPECPTMYPTAEEFVEQTQVIEQIRPLPDSQDLRTSLSEIEVKEVERQLREAHMAGVKDVYERLRDATAHVGERFTNGKRKSDAILSNVTELVSALEGLNIPDADGNVDEDLDRIGTQIAGQLLDKDLDEIWEDDELKKEKASKANEISEEIEGKIREMDDKLKGYI